MKLFGQCFAYLQDAYKLQLIGKYWHLKCPVCNQPQGRSMHYHEDSNTIRCYQPACHFHGKFQSTLNLISYIEGTEKVRKILEKYKGSIYTKPVIPRTRLSNPPKIHLPKNFISIRKGTGRLSEMARQSLTKRGFDLEYLESLGVGYVKQAGSKYSMRIIIPFFDYLGRLVFFQGRDFTSWTSRRWTQPTEEEFNIGASKVLYNEAQLWENDYCFLNEGATDVWTLKTASGTIGKSLSSTHIFRIKKSPVKEIYMCYDAGAYLDSLHAGFSILKANKKVKILPLEEGDANSLGKEKIQQIADQTHYLTYESYFNELQNIRIEGEKTFKGQTGKIISLW